MFFTFICGTCFLIISPILESVFFFCLFFAAHTENLSTKCVKTKADLVRNAFLATIIYTKWIKHHVISILGVSRALPFGLHVYGYVVTVSMCTNNSVLTDLEWVSFLFFCGALMKSHWCCRIFGCGETVKTQPASCRR